MLSGGVIGPIGSSRQCREGSALLGSLDSFLSSPLELLLLLLVLLLRAPRTCESTQFNRRIEYWKNQIKCIIGQMIAQLLLLCALLTVVNVQAATITDASQLHVDKNSRLTTNYLFYAASADCASELEGAAWGMREVVGVSDEIMSKMLKTPVTDSSRCPLVCIEKGYLAEFIIHPLPESVGLDVENFDAFVSDHCQTVDLHYCNYHSRTVNVYWIDGNGNRHFQGDVTPKEHVGYGTQKTYLGHSFEFRDKQTDELLREVTVTHEMAINIGSKPPNPALQHADAFVARLNQTAIDTFEQEWMRSHKVKRTFSEFGFQKSKLPLDVWASMTAYYYNNEKEAISEDWTGNGIFVNWWEQNSVITRMTHRLRVRAIRHCVFFVLVLLNLIVATVCWVVDD
jgi:hypothetical protein